MIVQPIVEGQGDEAATPVLLRRLVGVAEAWEIQIARPHRRKRSLLVQRDTLVSAIRVARLTEGCAAILVLLDADDDCPKELAPRLTQWAREAADPIPCEVVVANREYEAWLLAGIAPLLGTHGLLADTEPHPAPEIPRDAKGQLEARMSQASSYMPTVDQPRLTAGFDMPSAYRACRSFRKLVKAFGVILTAAGSKPGSWPPESWHEPEQAAP